MADDTTSLKWTCEECGGDARRGVMYLPPGEVRVYEEAMAAWNLANPGPVISGGALLDLPHRARWHVVCEKHLPEREEYEVDLERCRTPRELLDWLAHLMEKGYAELTNLGAIARFHGKDA